MVFVNSENVAGVLLPKPEGSVEQKIYLTEN